MTETTKNQGQLLNEDFPDNQEQLITPENYRNFVVSVFGVGASESDTGATPASVETGRGLERLGNRRFRVLPNGDGIYKFDAEGQFDIDIESNVFVAIVKNDIPQGSSGGPDFVLKRRAYPGQKNEATNYIQLYEIHEVIEGDIIELQFQETGGANVSDVDYVFTGFRIG